MKKAIREGKIKIGNVELRVAVLEDGERIILAEDLPKLFEGGARYTTEEAAEGFKKLNEL